MRSIAFKIILGLWVSAVCTGTLFLTHYSNKPGKAAVSPEMWPPESSLSLHAHKPTMLVMLHPQCSCSRATLAELERLVSEAGSKVDVQVVFFESANKDSSWVMGDLWNKAKKIPGATLVKDTNGAMIQAFGAFTSGQTLLYDTSGELLFKGGITPARGHEGDNIGKKTVLDLIEKRSIQTDESFVFGCSILGAG